MVSHISEIIRKIAQRLCRVAHLPHPEALLNFPFVYPTRIHTLHTYAVNVTVILLRDGELIWQSKLKARQLMAYDVKDVNGCDFSFLFILSSICCVLFFDIEKLRAIIHNTVDGKNTFFKDYNRSHHVQIARCSFIVARLN